MNYLPLARSAGVVFGLCFVVVGLLGLRYGLATLSWPSAPAKIIISEHVGPTDHGGGNIVAAFKLGPAIYHCGQVVLGRDNGASDVRAYPVGRQITVHYKPDEVSRCVFIPGISWGGVAFLLAGIAALGLGLYAHLALRRHSRLA
jgi:hypothetical protein